MKSGDLMSDRFKAIQVDRYEGLLTIDITTMAEAELMPGDVTVEVEYSGLNYKDGLGLCDKAPIYKTLPMVPGVDFAGRVLKSDNPGFKPGDAVILTGHGVGESHFGGYAERARLPGEWLVKCPDGLTTRDAMAIGTAGFTSMLCVLALEEYGVTPKSGDVLVTGAAGGVGSLAVALLAKRGFKVTASTGRPEEEKYLKELGASTVIGREDFADKPRPLASTRWAAAVDVAGSVTLANVLSQMDYGGVVAACGLAQGMDLPATVAPFILRGVKLVGVDSVYCPKDKRVAAWKALATELDRDLLARMTVAVPLDEVREHASDIVAGKVKGRVLVEI